MLIDSKHKTHSYQQQTAAWFHTAMTQGGRHTHTCWSSFTRLYIYTLHAMQAMMKLVAPMGLACITCSLDTCGSRSTAMHTCWCMYAVRIGTVSCVLWVSKT